MDSQQIIRKRGFTVRGERIVGGEGLVLRNCVDVVLQDLDISGSRFSGLNLHGCRNVRVIGGRFYENGRHKSGSNSGRIGHGIHLAGDSENISVEGAECFKNFEDGLQTANSFTGTATLLDCDFHDNLENAVDQKGGTVIHIRPDYRENGDGRGMEAIVVHNHAVRARIHGGRLAVKDIKASCLKVAEGGVVQVQGTVLDARNSRSYCVQGFENTAIELFEAVLLGNPGSPLVRSRGRLRMTSCRLRGGAGIWLVSSGNAWTREQVLRGIADADLTVADCREGDEPA